MKILSSFLLTFLIFRPAIAEESFSSLREKIPKKISHPQNKDNLTQKEISILRQQIANCWNPPLGCHEASEINIEIKVSMEPDGTIKEVQLLDIDSINSDPLKLMVANSALRALYKCSPLKLPLKKYVLWKEINFTFNPKDLF
jgi:hypothetical protein